MFMFPVTQRGDVCHVKWKHHALCLCIWTEKRDRFLWKCRYHLGHCSQDSPSRVSFFIPSVGLTEHLCFLDFHLPGEMLDSENTIFPCSLVSAETMWLLTLPFLIVCHVSQLRCIFFFSFWEDNQDILPCVLLQYHLFCHMLEHGSLFGPDASTETLESVKQWWVLICLPVWTMTTPTSVPVPSVVSAQLWPNTTTIYCIYVVSGFTSPTLPLSLSYTVSGCLLPVLGTCYC